MNNLPVVRSPWRIVILLLGFTFLYAPMLMLVIYSFNSSKLVTVWAGWSTRWYGELLRDDAMMSAVGLSLTIAACAATAAAILGTIAAVVLVRFGRFRGSNGFAFMITAPLVMPDVITGLSLLLLFVALAHAIGWPADRGMLTIWLAHVTFCTAYVAVVISSRLRELDRSIEEAAMDLGATPLKVFFVITLPMIMPAIISGWLLAFTLSLDDLVIASFVSGPGATTLPMLVFSSVRMGVNPEINALATLILGAVGIVGFIAWYLMARAEKQRIRDIQRARRIVFMEDETLGFFKKTSSSHARLNVPALVQVAALAIIMIRGLDVLMIFNTLGVRGIGEFIHRSVQTWSLTLVFLSSLVLVFIEIWCAFSLVKGRRWARWLYLLTQITAASYLWAASLGYGYPELFSIPGESKREIFHSLMLQKLPDMLILMLLFVPSTSRRFFQLQ